MYRKGGVLIRTIRRQYLKVSILVHLDKGGRCDKDMAVRRMKLLSASFQITSTYCQNGALRWGSDSTGTILVLFWRWFIWGPPDRRSWSSYSETTYKNLYFACRHPEWSRRWFFLTTRGAVYVIFLMIFLSMSIKLTYKRCAILLLNNSSQGSLYSSEKSLALQKMCKAMKRM